MNYAGFWKRLCAAWVDSFIWMVGMYAVGSVLGVIMGGSRAELLASHAGILNILSIILGWIYAAGMESSSLQGTLGKMALGIKVTDLEGDRIGFGRATGRHFGKLISALILMIGFLMVPFTKQKQGLHDMMAGCLVVKK